MSFFPYALKTEMVEGGWLLTREFVYYSTLLKRRVVVPSGFFTDLASVPQLLQFIVPTATGKNRKAAVVHDYLCDPEVQKSYGITQSQADAVFREALKVCGVKGYQRWGLWLPVRTYQFAKGVKNKIFK